MEDVCKICNGRYKQMERHVKMKHDMDMSEYDALVIDEPVIEEKSVVEEKGIDPVKLKDNLFNVDKHENMTLDSFLEKYNITKTELLNLVTNYKTGKPVPITQQNKVIMDASRESAIVDKDKDVVSTTNSHKAEILMKEHGFVHVETKSGPPKTWVLKKK